ncbi:MAG: Ig-like domain-containing protein [Bacteroidota bacterium]
MASDYNWNFLLLPLFDFTQPSVLSVTPAGNATGVPTSSTVLAQFSEEMAASTVNTSTFELRNTANVLMPATISYNASARTAVLTPSGALATGMKYTATIKSGNSGVKDARGNTLAANYAWSFTTAVPTGDVTPPTVSSVSPANTATGVALGTAVSAVFSEAMNATTVTASTVQLRNASATVITAAVAYNAGTKTATLTPSSALAYSTTYTATVKGGASGVKDAAGNALVNNYAWTFTNTRTSGCYTTDGIFCFHQ